MGMLSMMKAGGRTGDTRKATSWNEFVIRCNTLPGGEPNEVNCCGALKAFKKQLDLTSTTNACL